MSSNFSIASTYNAYNYKILNNTMATSTQNISNLISTINSSNNTTLGSSLLTLTNSYMTTLVNQLNTLVTDGIFVVDTSGSNLFYQIKIQKYCNGTYYKDPYNQDISNTYTTTNVNSYCIVLSSDLFAVSGTTISVASTISSTSSSLTIVQDLSDLSNQFNGLLTFASLIA